MTYPFITSVATTHEMNSYCRKIRMLNWYSKQKNKLTKTFEFDSISSHRAMEELSKQWYALLNQNANDKDVYEENEDIDSVVSEYHSSLMVAHKCF